MDIVTLALIPPQLTQKPQPPPPAHDFEAQLMAVMRHADKGYDRTEMVIKQVLMGRPLSNAELLAMQAMVQRYSFEIDLLSKIVQSLVSGLKDLLKTQV
jgi:hypothetical protein